MLKLQITKLTTNKYAIATEFNTFFNTIAVFAQSGVRSLVHVPAHA